MQKINSNPFKRERPCSEPNASSERYRKENGVFEPDSNTPPFGISFARWRTVMFEIETHPVS
jgi:hypothetical protein